MEKLTECKSALSVFFNRDWTLTEKVLLMINCILFGIILGAIWSPKGDRTSTIGSYNSATQYEADSEDE